MTCFPNNENKLYNGNNKHAINLFRRGNETRIYCVIGITPMFFKGFLILWGETAQVQINDLMVNFYQPMTMTGSTLVHGII